MKLFISRNLSSLGDIPERLKNLGVQLTAQSLIDFQHVEYDSPSYYEWIFFGSRNAVKYFLEKNSIPSSIKIGCVGAKTAEYLESKHQIKSDFIGEGTDPSLIGQAFSKVQSGKVLFPQSNISLRSIQKFLKANEVIDLVAYKTISKANQLEKQDAYLFTSPSNIESYLEQNELDVNAKYYCLGKSTEMKLLIAGVKSVTTLLSIDLVIDIIAEL